MKRMILVSVLAVGLCLAAGTVFAASDITNTCTGLFTITGLSTTASGLDTAVGRLSSLPTIAISKVIYNIRSGNTDPNTVDILSGDTVEFIITWSNGGEADADTLVLTDYVPSGMTYVSGSVSDTEANCSTGSASEAGGVVTYNATGVSGTDPGPAASGVFRFQVTVN
jgi:uncharacterized repeat protein (TIGR01451 family)